MTSYFYTEKTRELGFRGASAIYKVVDQS